jgi:hypothetical protein
MFACGLALDAIQAERAEKQKSRRMGLDDTSLIVMAKLRRDAETVTTLTVGHAAPAPRGEDQLVAGAGVARSKTEDMLLNAKTSKVNCAPSAGVAR